MHLALQSACFKQGIVNIGLDMDVFIFKTGDKVRQPHVALQSHTAGV